MINDRSARQHPYSAQRIDRLTYDDKRGGSIPADPNSNSDHSSATTVSFLESRVYSALQKLWLRYCYRAGQRASHTTEEEGKTFRIGGRDVRIRNSPQ